MNEPVRIAVTGAAGQIGYSLLFRIASGELLGNDRPVILQLLEIPPALPALKGVVMELEDCAFPLLHGVIQSADPKEAFRDAELAFLVGSRPRTADIERRDLLQANANIFRTQGKALNEVANRNVRVLVVGNPANTNCYVAMKCAPDLPAKSFTSMMRLDHNRAVSQLATRAGVLVGEVEKVVIWGNHSPTMYPDYRFATASGKSIKDAIGDETWYREVFIPTVAKRGTAIIVARGLSSAASAANAGLDHMRDWLLGSDGKWVTMGIPSDGSYGIAKDFIYGLPVTCSGGEYRLVQNLDIDAFSRGRMDASLKELAEEAAAVSDLLKA